MSSGCDKSTLDAPSKHSSTSYTQPHRLPLVPKQTLVVLEPLFLCPSPSMRRLNLKEPTCQRTQPHAQPDHDSTYSLISSRTVYHHHHHHYTTQPSVRVSQRMAGPRSPFPGLPGRVVALLLAVITGLLLGGDHVQAAFVKPLGAGAAAVSKWLALFWGPFLLSLPLSISFDFPLSFSDPPSPARSLLLSNFPYSQPRSSIRLQAAPKAVSGTSLIKEVGTSPLYRADGKEVQFKDVYLPPKGSEGKEGANILIFLRHFG